MQRIECILCDTAAKSKKAYFRCYEIGTFASIYSRTADYASVLRIIGKLLLGEADNLAHYRIAKRGD